MYRECSGFCLWLKRRDKRNQLPVDLSRIEIIRERPGHEIKYLCECLKHRIGADVCKQLEIARMQIRVTKQVLKVSGCCECEMASVTADKPAQLIEKSISSPGAYGDAVGEPSVSMDCRFEKVLGCRRVCIPRQMLARWVVRCGEHFQLLLNLMRDT